MAKVAVVGDRDTVLGFQSIGMDIYPAKDGKAASAIVGRLAKERYAVVFVTEALAADMQETIERYRLSVYPALITIPSMRDVAERAPGEISAGMREVRQNAERAMGINIFNDK